MHFFKCVDDKKFSGATSSPIPVNEVKGASEDGRLRGLLGLLWAHCEAKFSLRIVR